MAPKFVLSSKTAWLNMLIAAAVEIFPSVATWASAHPQISILACAGVNYLARHFTEGGLSYGPAKP